MIKNPVEKQIEELKSKIEYLEKEKVGYLEADNNAYAKRIDKRIEQLKLQIELFYFDALKQELSIYKKVVMKYPNILQEVKIKLSERKL